MNNGNLKRVDTQIIDRILIVVYEYGRHKKSILARKCNMSYDKLIKYLDFLDLVGLITIEDSFESKTVNLTQSGITYCKLKLTSKHETKTNKTLMI